jgi:hypothetical protein
MNHLGTEINVHDGLAPRFFTSIAAGVNSDEQHSMPEMHSRGASFSHVSMQLHAFSRQPSKQSGALRQRCAAAYRARALRITALLSGCA